MITPTPLKEVLTASIRDFKAPEIAHYILNTSQSPNLIQLSLTKNELKLVLLNLNFDEESPGMKSKIRNALKLMK